MPRRNRFRTRSANPGWGVSDQLSGRPYGFGVNAINENWRNRPRKTPCNGLRKVGVIYRDYAGRRAMHFTVAVGHGLVAMVLVGKRSGISCLTVIMNACNSILDHLVMVDVLCVHLAERAGRCKQSTLQRTDQEKDDSKNRAKLRGADKPHVSRVQHKSPSTTVREFCQYYQGPKPAFATNRDLHSAKAGICLGRTLAPIPRYAHVRSAS